MGVLKIAHRGLSMYHPENSLQSFRAAVRKGCNYIEFDVRKTKDDIPVIMHDSDVSRTANGGGKVKDKTLAELNLIQLKCGEQIPTLDKVITEFETSCKFDIEIKSKDTANVVVSVVENSIRRGTPIENFIITSFKFDEILKVKQLNPEIPVGIIPALRPLKALRFASEYNIPVVVMHHKQVTKKIKAVADDLRIDIFAYTVNDVDDIQKMKDVNVKGIITDDVSIIDS